MRKTKNPLENHSDVNVRLMGEFLAKAFAMARAGNVEQAATLVRCAYRMEQSIPNEIRLPFLKEAA